MVAELNGHSALVSFLSFSGDCTRLASASHDRTVRIWEVPTGAAVGEPLEHQYPVGRVFLDYNGAHALSAAFQKPGDSRDIAEAQVIPWRVAKSERLSEPFRATNWVQLFIEPGPNGRAFIAAGAAESFYRFEPFAPALTNKLTSPHGWSFAKDRNRAAFGDGVGMVHVFDLRTGEQIGEPIRHQRWVNTVSYSPDESRIFVGADDPLGRLWQVPAPVIEAARSTLPAPLQRIGLAEAFELQSAVPLPIFLEDMSLRFFGDDLNEVHRFAKPAPDFKFVGLARSAKSDYWVSRRVSPDDHAVYLWRRQDGETVGHLLQHPGTVLDFEFISDDSNLVTRCSDRVIRFWDVGTGHLHRSLREPKPNEGAVLNWSPDGKTAVWAKFGENAVRFISLTSGEFLSNLHVVKGASDSRYSRDAKLVAFLSLNGEVEVLDPLTGAVVSDGIKHSGNLTSIAWHPDGRRILTAGSGDEIIVWDARTGSQLLAPLRLDGDAVRIGRWSPDGRFIVARNGNRARVWDAATGEAVTPVLKHKGEVAFAMITPGDRLITATYPGLLRSWDLRPSPYPADLLADYAKLLSGRQLSSDGVLTPLTPVQAAHLAKSLRARVPVLFQ